MGAWRGISDFSNHELGGCTYKHFIAKAYFSCYDRIADGNVKQQLEQDKDENHE